MVQWEYRRERFTVAEDYLNHMGAEGWQLAAVDGSAYLIFMRPASVSNPEAEAEHNVVRVLLANGTAHGAAQFWEMSSEKEETRGMSLSAAYCHHVSEALEQLAQVRLEEPTRKE